MLVLFDLCSQLGEVLLDSLTPDSYDIIISETRKVTQTWKYDLITVSDRRSYIRSERSPFQPLVM